MRRSLLVLFVSRLAFAQPEIAARVGTSTVWWSDPETTAFRAEVEPGWRTGDVSLALVGGYDYFGQHKTTGIPVYDDSKDVRIEALDLLGRARLHLGHGFAGVGAGYEWRRETTDVMGRIPTTGTRYGDGWLFELHAGYTSARLRELGGGAVQGLVAAAATTDIFALRFGVGVQF